jgi:hypothetical protein
MAGPWRTPVQLAGENFAAKHLDLPTVDTMLGRVPQEQEDEKEKSTAIFFHVTL